jgi:hypothetical protein
MFSMTNRLLGIVIALALTSGVVAHAASAPQRPIAPVSLPTASNLPAALQTAASRISETATSTIDPAAAIRGAYQRDRVALAHLRQQASQLKGSAHPAFNQFISDQELALTQTERAALATTRPDAQSAIAAMDKLVSAAQAELTRQLSAATTAKSNSSSNNGQSQGGQSERNNPSGNSQGGNH